MRSISHLLACGAVLLPLPALAHITEVPHAHPHIVDFGIGQGTAVAGLLMLAVLLFCTARQFACRRHK